MKNFKVEKYKDGLQVDVIYSKANATTKEFQKYFDGFNDGYKYVVIEIKVK